MTLENIINAGKTERGVRNVVGDFRKNPTFNLLSELAFVDGTADEFNRAGIDPTMLAGLTPAQMAEFGNTEQRRYKGSLISEVQNNYNAALEGFGDGDEGRANMVGLLANIEAREYNGVNEDIHNAHKELLEIIEVAGDERRSFAKLNDDYGDNKKGIAGNAIMHLARTNPEIAKVVMAGRARAAQNNLYEVTGGIGNARSYLRGLYDSADDDGKKEIAYAIGRGLTEIHAPEA